MAEYVHQTYNQLTFDKVRSVQYEIELLKSYLRDSNDFGCLDSEIAALRECSTILFDSVYKPLREKWASD